MRVLGLDYGSARCGCALSDPTGTIVTPLAAIARPAERRGMAALGALVADREVRRVVVGLPLSLSGGDTQQTRETREFARRLSARLGEGVPVQLHDERFTTRMAQRMEGAVADEDSRAAAHLLESWLAAQLGAAIDAEEQQ
jgi:putative holliday junction resolvase